MSKRERHGRLRHAGFITRTVMRCRMRTPRRAYNYASHIIRRVSCR